MKIRTFVTGAALLLTALTARADYSYKESFTKSGPFKPDGVLSLDNVNGNVEIRAWDKNEIQIQGEKSAATEEELKQIDLTMAVTDGRADLKVHLPRRSSWFFGGNTIRAAVRFTINVPAGISVDRVHVVNATVRIEGVRGNVEIESVNGTIRAAGLAGDTQLKTVNGSIHAGFNAVKPQQRLVFETVNGSITAQLPADTSASVHVQTVNGHISTDFPLTVEGKFVGRHIDGQIGSGGAEIRAQTVNGAVKLERS